MLSGKCKVKSVFILIFIHFFFNFFSFTESSPEVEKTSPGEEDSTQTLLE